MIGYWIAQALSRTVPGRAAACLLCRTLVRADDPAMSCPVKFVGPVYDEQLAKISSYVDIGRAEGATLLADGHRATVGGEFADGYFFEPTVLRGHAVRPRRRRMDP